ALGSSMNSPAVQTAAFDTVAGVLDVAHRMGITTMPDPTQYGVSIATGGSSVTLYDMTYMYSTIANNGDMRGLKLANPKPGYRQVDPVAVLKITDRNENTIYEFKGPDHYQAEDPRYVYEISNILADDSAKRLTYSPHLFDLRDGRPIAAKTGTQQGETLAGVRATWNFGYIPDVTVGVWVGNSDGSFVNSNLLSATSSLYVWKDIMQLVVDKYQIPPKNFVVPPGLARGLPIPQGARAVGCGLVPDLYVVGQTVTGPPVSNGQSCTVLGTPGPNTGSSPRPAVTQAAPVLATAPPVGTPLGGEGQSAPPQQSTPTESSSQPQQPAAQPQAPPGQASPSQAPPAPQAPSQPPPAAPPPTEAPQGQYICPPGLIVPTAIRNQVCSNSR
ncbi:MAG TPA: hypothetical protein VFA70_09870, partial [Dehalococcoidia bacterium]|nr:hypothetical protein [Dehalococcoidia bacterium]